MNTSKPLISVKLEGKAIGSGRIGVSHLLRLLESLNKAFLRCGQVLQGETDSTRKGSKGKRLKEELSLELVQLTHGSPSTVLGFDRKQSQPNFPELDIGLSTIEYSINGLNEVQGSGSSMPHGFDTGVLMAWRDLGVLLEDDVNQIEITLNHRDIPISTKIDCIGYQNIQNRIKGPSVNTRTIEGRLLMADFKEHGTRCRIHPSVGEPVICLFDEEQKEEVLDDITKFVRIIGEAIEDPLSGRITSIKIRDIKKLDDKNEVAVDLLPSGKPLPSNFWTSLSMDELAFAQGVTPLSNIESLFNSWPGEVDDGFEESIHELRQQSIVR